MKNYYLAIILLILNFYTCNSQVFININKIEFFCLKPDKDTNIVVEYPVNIGPSLSINGFIKNNTDSLLSFTTYNSSYFLTYNYNYKQYCVEFEEYRVGTVGEYNKTIKQGDSIFFYFDSGAAFKESFYINDSMDYTSQVKKIIPTLGIKMILRKNSTNEVAPSRDLIMYSDKLPPYVYIMPTHYDKRYMYYFKDDKSVPCKD